MPQISIYRDLTRYMGYGNIPTIITVDILPLYLHPYKVNSWDFWFHIVVMTIVEKTEFDCLTIFSIEVSKYDVNLDVC